MNHEDQGKKSEKDKDASIKPEPETLNTTDPQDNMEGPISSLIKGAGKSFDTDESKEEADEEKDKNM